MFRGERNEMKPPIQNIDDYWAPHERVQAQSMMSCSVIGGPEAVKDGLAAFKDRTQADEFIIMSDTWDVRKRFRSLELIAAAGKGL